MRISHTRSSAMVQVSRRFELLGIAIGSDDFIHQDTVERAAQAREPFGCIRGTARSSSWPSLVARLRWICALGAQHAVQSQCPAADCLGHVRRHGAPEFWRSHRRPPQRPTVATGRAWFCVWWLKDSGPLLIMPPLPTLLPLEPPCSQPLTSMPASAWTLSKLPLKLLLLCPLSTTAFCLGRLLLWRRPWLPPNTTFVTAWILLWDEQLLQASLVSRVTLHSDTSQEPGLPYSGPHWQSADGTSPIRGRTPSSTRYS